MSLQGSKSFRRGFRLGLPLGLASILLSLSFGVLAQPLMGSVAPIVMSALMFAGSAQLAAVAVLAAGGDALAAIVAGTLLNLRYVPMGIAIAPSMRGTALRRGLISQTLVDFSWAVANRGGGRFDIELMMGATAPAYPCWVVGTAIGTLSGDLIGDPAALGLDAIFPAFFLALLLEGELSPGLPRAVALLGSIIALVLIPFTPAGVPVIAASSAALLGLLGGSRAERAEEAEG